MQEKKTLGARGRKKTRPLLPGTQVQKHLSRARQWALVDGAKEGGGERKESTARKGTHKYTTRAHADTNNSEQY